MIDWNLLGIEPTDDIGAIKRAYAIKSKEYHPEEQPEKFQQLHSSYKEAVAKARKGRKVDSKIGQPEPSISTNESRRNVADEEFPPSYASESQTHQQRNDFSDTSQEKNENDSQSDIFDKIDTEIKMRQAEIGDKIYSLLKMLDVAFSYQNTLKISYAVNELKENEDFKKYKDDSLFLKALCEYLRSKNYRLKELTFLYALYDLDDESSGGGKYDDLLEIINEQVQVESAESKKRKKRIIQAASITIGAAVIILGLLFSNGIL